MQVTEIHLQNFYSDMGPELYPKHISVLTIAV